MLGLGDAHLGQERDAKHLNKESSFIQHVVAILVLAAVRFGRHLHPGKEGALRLIKYDFKFLVLRTGTVSVFV